VRENKLTILISQTQFAESGSFVTARRSIGSTNAAGPCGREVSLSFAGTRQQGISRNWARVESLTRHLSGQAR
jgi:hypothetical protein